MALIDNLKGRTKWQPPQALEIQKRVDEAQAALIELEATRDAASLEALSGSTDGLAKLNAEVDAAKENLALLQAAYRGAVERDKQVTLGLKRDMIESAYKSVISRLALRDKSADLFAVALAEASKHYRTMLEQNTAAREVWEKAGMSWPNGATSERDLTVMAADEGWRHTSGDISGNDPFALPAPAFSKLEYKMNPGAIARIDDKLREDSGWIKDQLAKKLPR